MTPWERTALRALRDCGVIYNTPRKTGRHTMFRAECQCGAIGKCRPTRAGAMKLKEIDQWTNTSPIS